MTKKDYILIARCLRGVADVSNDQGDENSVCVVREVARTLANSLCNDNPRFDRGIFLAACAPLKDVLKP